MYFLLEGFDFGVGHAAPVRPALGRGAEHALRTIGPVWDGNEVWLVVAGGATFAAFPAWYATMFSGFYLALLLILFFLIVRVVSFEWRSKSETPRWRATWTWANTIGSFGAALALGHRALVSRVRRADQLRRRLHRRPPGSLQPVQRVRGRRGRGAVRVPRCDLPHAAHDGRAARPRRSRGTEARDTRRGRWRRVYLVWTVAVAMDRNDKDLFPPALPAAVGIAALALAVAFVFAAAERPRVRDDGAGNDLARRHALRQPVPARHGVEHRLREQPDRRRRRLVALRAAGHERRRADLRSARPPVPGLDVLRLPPPRRRGDDRAVTSRSTPSPLRSQRRRTTR